VFLKYAASCKNGEQWVTAEDFGKRINRQKEKAREWRSNNRQKMHAHYREWLESNRDKARQACKNWAAKNKEKRKRDFKVWAEANGDKIKASYQRNKDKNLSRIKRRRKTDSIYAMKSVARNRIKNVTRSKGMSKVSVSEQSLGCRWDFFTRWIETQFLEGMKWSERSKWHIDHIVPLNAATTELEVAILSHYSNLRPLWGKDNLSKGRKIPDTVPDTLHPKVKELWSKNLKSGEPEL